MMGGHLHTFFFYQVIFLTLIHTILILINVTLNFSNMNLVKNWEVSYFTNTSYSSVQYILAIRYMYMFISKLFTGRKKLLGFHRQSWL